jgi:hypothetical protein
MPGPLTENPDVFHALEELTKMPLGFWQPGAALKRVVELAATLGEAIQVLALASRVEAYLRTKGFADVLAYFRWRARLAPQRKPIQRKRLRRAIGWIDARMPGGGNCYRRVLLEIALDGGAARESVLVGFHIQTNQVTGHVWLLSEQAESGSYDALFQL